MAEQGKPIPVIIGVDIGGTNTDVVILHKKDGTLHVVADVKELTSRDVDTGVQKAILRALLQTKEKNLMVSPIQVNIGTTHLVNAVVQGKNLTKVSILRICGPVSEELPPFCDFPNRLENIIRGSVHLLHGGNRYDGKCHEPLDEEEICQVVREIHDKGIRNMAVIGIFSPTLSDQELRVRDIILDVFPEASVSLSHEVGDIGIIERENATILNECLKPLCKKTVEGFASALEEIGVSCPFYLTQNDGTIISSTEVLKYPVLTFASGPTNSMRGASFLSEKKDAVVVDIGGTTTDVGVLKNGFPRKRSSNVEVGGVRTNFRMPDVISIGLGGGSYVQEQRASDGTLLGVKVGPVSAGLNLKREAFVFSEDDNLEGRSLTATDIAVSRGLCSLGCKDRVKSLDQAVVSEAVDEIWRMVEDLVDKIKLSKENLPVIIVGGGSVLMDTKRSLRGVTEIIIPEYFGVANAIGAALSKVAVTSHTIVNLMDIVDVAEMTKAVAQVMQRDNDDRPTHEVDLAVNEARKPFMTQAREKAIKDITEKAKASVIANGGRKDTLEILEKHDSVLAYMPGNAIEISVKVASDLARLEIACTVDSVWKEPVEAKTILSKESVFTEKQNVFSTGQRIGASKDCEEDVEVDAKLHPKEPFIDAESGEWILSEWDIECILVGAGMYGCGGGASTHMGRIRALKYIRDGKKMRVITPERLLKGDNENGIVICCAYVGAPLIMHEQGVSSAETTTAFECLRDIYEIGNYKDGALQNDTGVTVETNEAGVTFIPNYQPVGQERTQKCKVVGLISAEMGGLNAIEPFLIAANLDIPIVDADGMSRAFPEVQMFCPFMYGKLPYPVAIVGSGNCSTRNVLLNCPHNKLMENFIRDVSIENGCSAGFAVALDRDEILDTTALYTVSSAWRLGNAVLRARLEKESIIEAITEHENAKHIITGKVTDVQRETTGGFNRGWLIVEGIDEFKGQEVLLEFQNENLVIISMENGQKGECIGCVPDLISVVDADTAESIQTEAIKYGLRVAVLLMPSHKLLRQPEALKWVGPQAFNYPESIGFKPFRERYQTQPISP